MASTEQTRARNRLLLSGACLVFVYLVALGVQWLPRRAVEAGNWLAWMLAPAVAAAFAARFALAWMRCKAASKSLVKEKEALLNHLREVTYNINNPLNAITAHIIALRGEYSKDSVDQIEISSRRIAKVVSNLASLDLSRLAEGLAQPAEAATVDVEQTSRGLSL